MTLRSIVPKLYLCCLLLLASCLSLICLLLSSNNHMCSNPPLLLYPSMGANRRAKRSRLTTAVTQCRHLSAPTIDLTLDSSASPHEAPTSPASGSPSLYNMSAFFMSPKHYEVVHPNTAITLSDSIPRSHHHEPAPPLKGAGDRMLHMVASLMSQVAEQSQSIQSLQRLVFFVNTHFLKASRWAPTKGAGRESVTARHFTKLSIIAQRSRSSLCTQMCASQRSRRASARPCTL